MNWGLRKEFESDLHSNEHYLSSSLNIRPEKNSGLVWI